MTTKIDVEEARRLYIVEGLTTRQIASLFGVDQKTISRQLNKVGVEMRFQGKEPIASLMNRDWLKCEYISKHKTTIQIAKEIGCSSRSVSTWLTRHGIQSRPTKESGYAPVSEAAKLKMSISKRGKYIGDANPNWRGGIQVKHPERNRYRSKMWVKAVKDRDGWKCMECTSTDRLHAHHIKRWQDYPDLRYDIGNGKTLCQDCHEKAHGRGFKFPWLKHAKMPTSASAPS